MTREDPFRFICMFRKMMTVLSSPIRIDQLITMIGGRVSETYERSNREFRGPRDRLGLHKALDNHKHRVIINIFKSAYFHIFGELFIDEKIYQQNPAECRNSLGNG